MKYMNYGKINFPWFSCLRRALVCVLCMVLCTALLAGCGEGQTVSDEDEGGFDIYYINAEETKLEVHSVELSSTTQGGMIDEIMGLLDDAPVDDCKAPLNMGFEFKGYEVTDGDMSLDFGEGFEELTSIEKVLVRASIVRTLTQLEGVTRISFTVNSEPMKDSLGHEVGWLDKDTFISNDGNEINTYEQTRVKLYFATADGSALVGANREKFYQTSMSLERFIVGEIISGPTGQIGGLYATVNPQTTVLNVSTKDGVCYVNLDSNFMVPQGNVSTEIAVYSITNSLTSLDYIDRVQILVDGEVPATLSSTYEFNEDVVVDLDTARQIEAEVNPTGGE